MVGDEPEHVQAAVCWPQIRYHQRTVFAPRLPKVLDAALVRGLWKYPCTVVHVSRSDAVALIQTPHLWQHFVPYALVWLLREVIGALQNYRRPRRSIDWINRNMHYPVDSKGAWNGSIWVILRNLIRNSWLETKWSLNRIHICACNSNLYSLRELFWCFISPDRIKDVRIHMPARRFTVIFTASSRLYLLSNRNVKTSPLSGFEFLLLLCCHLLSFLHFFPFTFFVCSFFHVVHVLFCNILYVQCYVILWATTIYY